MSLEMPPRPGHPPVGSGVVLAVTVVLAGCMAGPVVSPSPAAIPNSSVAPSVPASATASPTNAATWPPLAEAPSWIPFGEPLVPDEGTTASAERGGARLTLEIETNPLFGTRDSWIVTTLENRGRDAMHWLGDRCEFHEGVQATAAAAWKTGAVQTGPLAAFKDQAIEYNPAPIKFEVTPESVIGLDPALCDGGTDRELGPGEKLVERTRWTGETLGGYGVGPDAPVLLRVRFTSLGWHRDGELERSRDDIIVELVAGIVGGRDPAFLSPWQAVDAAFQSPEFRTLLEGAGTPGYEAIILNADTDSATWQVGAKLKNGARVIVTVDGLLGTVTVLESS